MGISTRWANEEKTILLIVIAAPWTWDEMETTTAEMNSYLDGVSHQVHIIMDITSMGNIPSNGLNKSLEIGKNTHPRAGRIIVVGGNLLAQMTVNTVSRVLTRISRNSQPIASAGSLEEAFTLLKQP